MTQIVYEISSSNSKPFFVWDFKKLIETLADRVAEKEHTLSQICTITAGDSKSVSLADDSTEPVAMIRVNVCKRSPVSVDYLMELISEMWFNNGELHVKKIIRES